MSLIKSSKIFYVLLVVLMSACSRMQTPDTFTTSEQTAKIDPDYSNVVIPPNIAPLNFKIDEPGENFFVQLSGQAGEPIVVSDKKGQIAFPLQAWKSLLALNKGREIQYDIFIKRSQGWIKFQSFQNRVAHEPIDSHLVYRLINPAYKYWNKMGIYQRNLQNFDEKPVITNKMTDGNCMNCHNFAGNDPSNMVFHMRAGKGSGTYISTNGEWRKVNLKTDFNKGGAYPSWHPNGEKIAFSVNSLTMFYHSIGENRDVLDRESDLVIYDVRKNLISASPQIADVHRMETFPAWSADGHALYFCAAPPLDEFVDQASMDLKYDEIRYDLMRAEYDVDRDAWGQLETIVSAESTGKSAVLPRPSPDGKYVLFTMADYGSFPIYHHHGDLYMLNVESGDYYPLDINSDPCESFHSWSRNSRWFVFTSTRRDGLLCRPFFAYVDENGEVSRPFLLPQKDPEFYATYLINYNVPELAKSAIQATPHQIFKVAYDNEKMIQAELDPRVRPRKKQNEEEIDALYKASPNG